MKKLISLFLCAAMLLSRFGVDGLLDGWNRWCHVNSI